MLFLLLLCLSVFSPQKILATNLDQAKNDYLYQRSLYQIDYNNYQEKLQIHQKFFSITTKQDLFEAQKKVLISRNQNLKTYLIYLRQKLNQSQFRQEINQQLSQQLLSHENWLFDQVKQIGNSRKLAELKPISFEFNQKYPEILNTLYSALSQIQITQQQSILLQITQLKQEIQNQNSQVDPQWFENFDQQTKTINQHLQNAFLLVQPENNKQDKDFYQKVKKELKNSQSLLIKTKEDLKSIIVKFF